MNHPAECCCSVHLAENSACVTGRWKNHCDRVNQRLKRVLCAEFEISTSEIIEESIEQLNEYFAGQRKEFSVPLLFVGTDFQKTVWNELLKIPFGRTISYGEMARSYRDAPSSSCGSQC